MSHTGLLLYCTESCNFQWMVFPNKDALTSFFCTDKICSDIHQNTLFILILVCLTENTKWGRPVLVTLLLLFPSLIASLF